MTGASIASATNQKLDAARRLIQQSQACNEHWLCAGLESSAIFQLRSALNGLLQEVRTAYGLSFSWDVTNLLEQAAQKGLVIPVLSELGDLLAQPQSWCSQLQQAYLVEFECRTSTVAVVGEDLIGKGGDEGASVGFYLSKLVELVLRFREESSEY
ncbi:DUF6586 family protein [Marinomonas dokdonensis]|uniref:DUF6586 family protein n=1 Tax=Marinomonas dokdonensis TaxID=328224 RepID=UPI0040557FE9